MPFDPNSGVFDRKTLVRMAQALPRGADAAAPWLAQLTEAARNYHRRPVRDLKEAEGHKKQRKRLQGELPLFDKTMAILDDYRRNPRLTYDRGAPRTALEALGEVRAQTKNVLNDYDRAFALTAAPPTLASTFSMVRSCACGSMPAAVDLASRSIPGRTGRFSPTSRPSAWRSGARRQSLVGCVPSSDAG